MKSEILALQKEMASRNVDACLIPTSDYHQSEYVNAFFKCRAYLSGFTGSAGTLIVTADAAGLWTDGRYFLQADRQLDGTGITLFRSGEPGVDTIPEYLKKNLKEGARLAVDGRVISASFGNELTEITKEKNGELCFHEDLPDAVWSDRPTLTSHPLFILEEKYTGQSAADKLTAIRNDMKEHGADIHLVASLDDIAWILNLRGGDVDYNPVFYSFLIITEESAILFAFEEALSPEILSYLKGIGVQIQPYGEFYETAAKMTAGHKVLLDENKANYTLISSLKDAKDIINHLDPSTIRKAIKNEAEITCTKEAHRKDGLAMVNFLYWIKHNIGKIPMTEISASDYLEQCRRKEGAMDLSFDTIAGYGPHGAIVHYSATPETDVPLAPEGLLLVDSGGQYWEGTTDITRTIALGALTDEMKEHFTLVLRCNLDLAMAVFKQGCTGANLDIFARMPLWERGLDFNHGTGHGVGFLLNVHEGPNRFHWKVTAARPGYEMAPGMVTTDEPGYYQAGSHGIRTENELLCVTKNESEYGTFLAFEQLTYCPIDRDAIVPELLTEAEKKYLNEYHEMVYQKLASGLEPEVAAWLREITLPIA